MKFSTFFILFMMFTPCLFPQNILDAQDPNQTLTSEKCYDVIKTVLDGLKKLSEEYDSEASAKSEFESTSEFSARMQKSKDNYVNNIRKFYSENKLNTRIYSVWLKADLVKYDADNQTYGLNSPTQILVQPKKEDITVIVPSNKYLTLTEKNTSGYRRAYIHLNTNPEFTWFVNKQTAQEAKNNQQNIFFKLSFTFDVTYEEKTHQILLQVVPVKLALMNKSENFVYWSEDIR
jgi:hypothetical protein